MGTVATVQIVGHRSGDADPVEATERAFAWFHRVEQCCSRFDETSEARQLSRSSGVATRVSPMLFEAVQFALALAEDTDGAFDPTVGHRMEQRGFHRHYRTGEAVSSGIGGVHPVTYRDIELDAAAQTITLRQPLVLDLGAVAKGLAIDMAVRELEPFEHFAVDAGGDLYLGGRNEVDEPWSVGIRHPREDGMLLDVLTVSDAAVCTSGDYERRSDLPGVGHHLMDPRTGVSADRAISATVLASTAMLADGLATAAFVLGPIEGLQLLERHGLDGLIVSQSMERHRTAGYAR